MRVRKWYSLKKHIINKKKGMKMLAGMKKCRTFAAGLEKVV